MDGGEEKVRTTAAARTVGLTGISVSLSSTPRPVAIVISLNVAASPPRVGSRINFTPLHSSRSLQVSSARAAQSLSICDWKFMSCRCDKIVIPWSPIVPRNVMGLKKYLFSLAPGVAHQEVLGDWNLVGRTKRTSLGIRDRGSAN